MKNFISRYLLLVTFCLLPFLLTGCFEDEVTFKGRAYIADTAYVTVGQEVKEVILLRGVIAGAKVKEAGHSEVATTDANGNYTLPIKVPRVIGLEKAKSYRLQCWYASATQGTVQGTVIHTGAGDEPIMNYAEAKAGDTVEVRDFILHQHTIEEYPGGDSSGGGSSGQ